jgi:ankyrin repeat protein
MIDLTICIFVLLYWDTKTVKDQRLIVAACNNDLNQVIQYPKEGNDGNGTDLDNVLKHAISRLLEFRRPIGMSHGDGSVCNRLVTQDKYLIRYLSCVTNRLHREPSPWLIPTQFAYTISDEVCKLLVDKGANVNAQDHCGQSILHHTVILRNFRGCNFLINNGADVNILDQNEETPLMC